MAEARRRSSASCSACCARRPDARCSTATPPTASRAARSLATSRSAPRSAAMRRRPYARSSLPAGSPADASSDPCARGIASSSRKRSRASDSRTSPTRRCAPFRAGCSSAPSSRRRWRESRRSSSSTSRRPGWTPSRRSRSPRSSHASTPSSASRSSTSPTSSAPSSSSSSGSFSSGARSSSTAAPTSSPASGTTLRTCMFESEFMRLAFGAGAVVGVLAPAVGFFLVQRRQSLIGDGIGHVAFAGVALGILLGVSPVLTALLAAVIGGVAIEFLRSRAGAAGDQALALVFYSGLALGVVFVSSAGALNVNLFQYLFGSILTVTRSDLVLISALGAVGLLTIGLLYRALAAAVLDEEGAQVAGVPIGALNIVVATLAAVTVALSMRVVGILLIAALMVLPVSAASRVAWSMRSTLVLSMAVGLASALVGLTLSYYADLPPGGTIVLVAASAFGVAAASDWVRRLR